jgi:hypothetical protein
MSESFTDAVERYISVWNVDDDERSALMEEVFTEDVIYVDNNVSVRGREALSNYIGQTRKQVNGLPFSLNGTVDGHHNQARFGWGIGPVGGSAVATGFDVALFEDGRVSALYGFFN